MTGSSCPVRLHDYLTAPLRALAAVIIAVEGTQYAIDWSSRTRRCASTAARRARLELFPE
jgi:hypothetical protein